MTGFECSSFPQIGMDEIELTQHYDYWASDLLRVKELGINFIRYGVPWDRVNIRPHEYDWRWTDQVMDFMQVVGITPVVDLYHFGSPMWLERGLLNPLFAEFQAEWVREFARRYPWVQWYTPTNEPYIMSSFAADFGVWYPFLTGPENFSVALKNVARGICLSWAEIVKERPDARMMISDTHEYWHPLDDGAQAYADYMNHRRFLTHDLYGGRVGDDYPMQEYLRDVLRYSEWNLEWYREHGVPLDVVGVDYYPHSEHQISAVSSENARKAGGARGVEFGAVFPTPLSPTGFLLDETAQEQFGFAKLVKQYFDHFQRPILLAETGAPGEDERKQWWLDKTVEDMRQVRAEGVPVIGITWWGAIDQVDWDSGLRQRNYNINPTGLWALQWNGPKLERVPTRALDAYKRYIDMPIAESVGVGGAPLIPLEPTPGESVEPAPANT